jgi:hypothetical protein
MVSVTLQPCLVPEKGPPPPIPHWIGGLVDLRTGLDTEARGKTLCFCQGLNPGCPVCNQILYSLSYTSSELVSLWKEFKVLLWHLHGGLRKPLKYISQCIWAVGRELNPGHEAGHLTTRPCLLVLTTTNMWMQYNVTSSVSMFLLLSLSGGF